MKASELMQGNIVRYEYEGRKFPARVVETYRNSVLVESISGKYEPIEIDDGKIFPIPLTRKIMERNGFDVLSHENPAMFAYKKEEVSIIEVYFNSPGHGCRCIFSYGDTRLRITCHLVHELQHALRLCGIDKEIEL